MTDPPTETTKTPKPPDAAVQHLIDVAQEAEVFHSSEGEPYARVPVGDHVEVHGLNSQAFKDWMTHQAYRRYRLAPAKDSLSRVVDTLKARARFEGPEMPVRLRIAAHEGAVYLDLTNDRWDVVEVSTSGWYVVPSHQSPVRFRRATTAKPLPTPASKQYFDVDLLRSYLNVDEPSWILLLSWLVMAFHPTGPYPVLSLIGEQGSAKSTAAELLRRLIDPSAAEVRGLPQSENDVMAAVANNWLLVYDNLSAISPTLSDTLCRISTGTAFAKRQLYSDTGEVVVAGARPIILTSITNVVRRPDLIDRSLIVSLNVIPEERRQSKDAVLQGFAQDAPRILGGLLDAAYMALSRRDTITLSSRPRMADFVEWVTAAEPCLPWKEGRFREVYDDHLREARATALAENPVATAVREFMAGRAEPWSGTATQLLGELAQFAPLGRSGLDWPKDATRLSAELSEIAPLLREVGIEMKRGQRSGVQRQIILRRLSEAPSGLDPTHDGNAT